MKQILLHIYGFTEIHIHIFDSSEYQTDSTSRQSYEKIVKVKIFTRKKKLPINANPPTPFRGGFVFVFPLVFPHLFPKVSKQSQTYEPVSILDIDYLCPIP